MKEKRVTGTEKIKAGCCRADRKEINPDNDSSLKGFDEQRAEMPAIMKELHVASKLLRQEERKRPHAGRSL